MKRLVTGNAEDGWIKQKCVEVSSQQPVQKAPAGCIYREGSPHGPRES